MLIRIENPNNQMPWIVIQTDSIVSISPTISAPNHCLVSLVDRDNFYLTHELAEELLAIVMPARSMLTIPQK